LTRRILSGEDEMNKPVMVVNTQAYETDGYVCGLFTSRDKAEAYIKLWDDACRAATKAGVAGVCQVGDLAIEDGVEVDPVTPEDQIGEFLYLHRYFGT
jgi:hypothetical protein